MTILQYTDDIVIYCTQKDPKKGKNLIEEAINRIYKNLSNLGLDLEPSKTNIIVFNNKKDSESKLYVE